MRKGIRAAMLAAVLVTSITPAQADDSYIQCPTYLPPAFVAGAGGAQIGMDPEGWILGGDSWGGICVRVLNGAGDEALFIAIKYGIVVGSGPSYSLRAGAAVCGDPDGCPPLVRTTGYRSGAIFTCGSLGACKSDGTLYVNGTPTALDDDYEVSFTVGSGVAGWTIDVGRIKVAVRGSTVVNQDVCITALPSPTLC